MTERRVIRVKASAAVGELIALVRQLEREGYDGTPRIKAYEDSNELGISFDRRPAVNQ